MVYCTVCTLHAVVRDCCRGIFKLTQAIIMELITMGMKTCEVCTLYAAVNGCCKRISNLYYLYLETGYHGVQFVPCMQLSEITMEMETCTICTLLLAVVNGCCCKRNSILYYLYITLRKLL